MIMKKSRGLTSKFGLILEQKVTVSSIYLTFEENLIERGEFILCVSQVRRQIERLMCKKVILIKNNAR
jgi:hypothetical protein